LDPFDEHGLIDCVNFLCVTHGIALVINHCVQLCLLGCNVVAKVGVVVDSIPAVELGEVGDNVHAGVVGNVGLNLTGLPIASRLQWLFVCFHEGLQLLQRAVHWHVHPFALVEGGG